MVGLWLEAWTGPCAWLSLDEEENDLRSFLDHALAAIADPFPRACEPTRSLLQDTELPPAIPPLRRDLLLSA